MATNHSIISFPTNTDRNYFGAWLSGFTDGEGCFLLNAQIDTRTTGKKWTSPSAGFSIKLRDDDTHILLMIQSYLSCGTIGKTQHRPPSKPQTTFRVNNAEHLRNVIIPHFERFPLMAKKRADFDIWKTAVEIIYNVVNRPHRFAYDPSCKFPGGKRLPNWDETELNKFFDIQDALHEQRQYRGPYRYEQS